MPDTEVDTSLEPVSVEHDGRVLTGVGVTPDELQETMEARPIAPPKPAKADAAATTDAAVPPPAEPVEPATAANFERNDDGTFRKVSRGQKRFDELTRQRGDAERIAKDTAAERDRLKAELDALRAAPQQPPRQQPQPVQPQAPPMTRAKPLLTEVGTKYPSYEDFTEDLADWKAEQKFFQAAPIIDARIRASIEADRASRAFADSNATVVERGRATYADFDATIAASTVDFPHPMLSAIAQHPQSEHLRYKLAKDPTVAQQVVQLYGQNPLAAGAALERLLGPLDPSPSPASTGRSGVITSAPAPYQPVGSGTKTTTPSHDDLAGKFGDDFDSSGYREKRAAERRGGGARR